MRNVLADGHDEDAWRGALAASPALRRVRDEGAARFDGYGDLLADTFHLLRQPVPRWATTTRPTLHHHLLQDLGDLSEFRELRALALDDADNAAMATCVLGRLLARQLDQALADMLAAEADAFQQLDAADDLAGEAEDLATTLGEGHAAVDAARSAAEVAMASAGAAVAKLVDPGAPTADDLLAAFRRDARLAVREAAATMARVAEADGAIGGGTGGGLAAKLALAEKLGSSSKLQDLVAVAGRIKRVALACRAAVVKDIPPETVGVTVGGDISRALPSELALLTMPATKPVFMKKLGEGQLLVREQRGEERLGGGPIVIALDGSGSMRGAREVWSKAVCLAYMAIATREKRDVVVGQFGGTGEIVVQKFPCGSRPTALRQADVLACVERFLDAGSTDLEGALRWAVGQVGTDAKLKAADIVVLSDAEAALSPSFLAEWRSAQARLHFRSYAVLIGDVAGAAHLGMAIDTVVTLPDVAADGDALAALFGTRQ